VSQNYIMIAMVQHWHGMAWLLLSILMWSWILGCHDIGRTRGLHLRPVAVWHRDWMKEVGSTTIRITVNSAGVWWDCEPDVGYDQSWGAPYVSSSTLEV